MAIPYKNAPTVSVVTADAAFARVATGALAASGFDVATFESWADLRPARRATGVLVVDGEAVSASDVVHVEAAVENPALRLVWAAADDGALIEAFHAKPFVSCGLAKSQMHAPSELSALVRGLAAGKAWDVAVCLRPGTPLERRTVCSYDERDAVADGLKSFADAQPVFDDFGSLMAASASEMLMNAFLDAPLGQPPKPVEFNYGADGERLAFEVVDHFGRLTKAHVVDGLRRAHKKGEDQIKSGPGGAGVGLYLMYAYASQLHFVVEAGQTTRVVVVARLCKRHAEFEGGERALSIEIGP